MHESLKVGKSLFPMPVLIISTYNEDGSVDCMNAAWGTMEDTDIILIELTPDHKTSKNIERNKAFCVSICDKRNIVAGDYVGIVSANLEPNKFAKTGWTAYPAKEVNAPTIDELPVTLECQLERISTENNDYVVYGRIKGLSARKDCITNDGKVDVTRCEFVTYNSADQGYHVLGEKVADAFRVGLKLK